MDIDGVLKKNEVYVRAVAVDDKTLIKQMRLVVSVLDMGTGRNVEFAGVSSTDLHQLIKGMSILPKSAETERLIIVAENTAAMAGFIKLMSGNLSSFARLITKLEFKTL